KIYVLLKVKDFKFIKAVIPGDRLEIKAECLRASVGLYEFSVQVFCDGKPRAKGDLLFTAVEKESIYREEA
ncbi:MAG: beta-hydroxyacyl-ACP dehydratase, partial [Lachnospiraceae bacterium]|nr:beta-hydroxyacyl-ACP dehydratase [Lachnospiraceae bacterium]